MEISVVSYNIHKGFSAAGRKYVLAEIKQALHTTNADIAFLQEIHGAHPETSDWTQSPLELLADSLWPHHSYGRNAVYTNGHHGNAILSKFPISEWENIDISTVRFANRGLLHAAVQLPDQSNVLHLICVHLDLFESSRQQQFRRIAERIRTHVPTHAPLLLAGDFNDWRGRASAVFTHDLGLREVFTELHGDHGYTFPSFRPFLPLDRIYCRGFQALEARIPTNPAWRRLSDHLPMLARLRVE